MTAAALIPAPQPVATPADRHPALVYLARLAPSGRRTMRAALDTIARIVTGGRADADTLPWPELRYQHTQALRTALADRYAPATANKHLSALRGVLRECWRLGLMGADDCHRACDLTAVRGSTLPAGRALAAGELAALFAACVEDHTAGGARDGALLAVLYAGGLRRAEAVALDLADYDVDGGGLTVRRGKGRKAREVYMTGGAVDAVAVWLQHRGTEPGALFCPVDRCGRVTIRPITGQAVLYALRKRGEQAGVPRFSPHDLRRTFVGDLLEAGADIATVQGLAGHASVTTTARYDRRPATVRRRAAGLLHVPYARPLVHMG